MMAKENGVSFRVEKDALQLILVMIAQFCEYANHHRTVLFKWMECMGCEIQLNEAVNKNRVILPLLERWYRYTFPWSSCQV